LKIGVNLATTILQRTKTTHEKNKGILVRTDYLFLSKLFFTKLMFLGPQRPSGIQAQIQHGPGSVNHSDTQTKLPPVPNDLNISSLFSSQSSNEVSHIRARIEST
jgi:hypothetical protein